MIIFSFLRSAFIPSAHASVTQLGQGAAGIDSMWQTISGLFPSFSGSGAEVFNKIFSGVQGFFIASVATVAVISIVYACLKLVFSGLTEEGITVARKIIIYALLGMLLAMFADGIITYVIDKIITPVAT